METSTRRLQNQLTRLWMWLVPLQLICLMAAIGLMTGVTGSMIVLLLHGDFTPSASSAFSGDVPSSSPSIHVNVPLPSAISPLFTPEVQHWASKIVEWSRQYGIDPNLVATVMQIESCGDSQAGSGAGAEGLFQVMPFHFQPGEDAHDPDTNARAGIAYLKGSLEQAGGHPGLALAGYNGGYGVISGGWGTWVEQTRLYYLWGSQIYLDALQNHPTSAALQDWLNAGGVNLCRQAAQRLTPIPSLSATPPLAITLTP